MKMKLLAKRAAATVAAAAMVAPFMALAQVGGDDSDIASSWGLGSNTDVRTAILSIVAYILTFLGLIAVLIVLYAGYLWMTAAGNDEKVSKARSTLSAGLIGLIIILAAYALTQFAITQITTQVTT